MDGKGLRTVLEGLPRRSALLVTGAALLETRRACCEPRYKRWMLELEAECLDEVAVALSLAGPLYRGTGLYLGAEAQT